MRQVLFVAEKNDVAKGVAGILSNGRLNRRDGRSRYNKIYQFEYDFQGQRSIIAVTSVSGHLMNLEFGPDMKRWEEVTTGNLFDAPVYLTCPDNMKDIERTLTEEARKSSVLVIWTDCDREGENIGHEIFTVCSKSNPRLDVYRARFSEITQRAIVNAVGNLTRIDQRTADAVYCRTELDLRIGAAFTRLQTLHLRKRFSDVFNADGTKVVSYGSCQFPTLGFVVERYKAIENFIEEPFWKLVVEHSRNGQKAEFAWERQRLFDRNIVNILYDECVEAAESVIESVTRKPKSKYRPYALDTVELEKLAVRKLRMSAKQAMTIAEKLYTQGYISYPRTETNKFPAEIDCTRLAELQTESGDWGQFATSVVQAGAHPRNGQKSDEAHPPIHPLKFSSRGGLQGDDWKVYELIVRHFLACISRDARGHETKATMRIGGEQFVATGLQVEDIGYLEVYPYEKWSDKTVPKYEEGERFRDHRLTVSEGKTQPPQLLNEADLIALMDKYGIGTDATHAEHIDKIKERQYVGVKPDGRFIPGFLGLALVDGYDSMGFAMSKPQLRADLEKQLAAICEGRRTKDDVLQEQVGKYKRIFTEAEVKITQLSTALARYLSGNVRAGNNGAPRPPGGGGGGGQGGPGGPGGPAPPPSGAPSTRGSGRPRGRPRGSGTGSGRGRGGRSATELQVPLDDLTLDPAARAVIRGRGRGRGGAGNTGRDFGGQNAASGANDPANCNCNCGQAAVQRTSRTEKNSGRKFYTCGSNPQCGFFQWID